jgi:hypothetical protein
MNLQIFFLMTTTMMSLLAISLDVHESTLLECWHVLWVAMGHMCNVNTCITSFRQLCLVSSHKSSFITARGVAMKFGIY